MNGDLLITQVRSQTIGMPGRCLNSARGNHFVVDEPSYMGGPGDAITPAETFLAGVSACGVLLVQGFAHERGIKLEKADTTIEGVRNRADPANFTEVNLRFELTGPTQEQAEQLVEAYKGR